MSPFDARLWSRRQASGAVLLAFGGVVTGCAGVDTPSAGAPSAGTDPNRAPGTGTTGSANAWASGGTKAMTGKASYPDPFATPSTTCVIVATATEGPCTEAADQVRQDISEGLGGLPMRLALRVVDRACSPIAGAKVKVWHTQISGSYSGDTPSGLCLKDAADSAKHYFRGVQTTDSNGRVDFDSCFPGWYPGRAIHIHYTVSLAGKSYTSQLLFDQTLVTEIFSNHVEYKGFGLPDTSNASDNIVDGGDLASHTLSASRLGDGALMAAKQLTVW